jgi:hypothetical protein
MLKVFCIKCSIIIHESAASSVDEGVLDVLGSRLKKALFDAKLLLTEV